MDGNTYNVKELKIADLISFKLHTSRTCCGERLNQFMISIERTGLVNPITVRPIGDGKYEIICGHNRTKAMKELGHDTILADIRDGLSDEDAIDLYYSTNLNQQSFSDWTYSERIKAIQFIEKLIKENSIQGKRTDLAEKDADASETGTSVYTGHKSKRSTTRDKMARRLGISTATLSKYRSIIKLSENLIESIACLLDERKVSFEAAYRMSKLEASYIQELLEHIEKSPDKKIDVDKLKAFHTKSKESGVFTVRSEDPMAEILIPRNPSPQVLLPKDTRHKDSTDA